MQPHKSLYSDVLVNFFFVIFVLKDAMIFFSMYETAPEFRVGLRPNLLVLIFFALKFGLHFLMTE